MEQREDVLVVKSNKENFISSGIAAVLLYGKLQEDNLRYICFAGWTNVYILVYNGIGSIT